MRSACVRVVVVAERQQGGEREGSPPCSVSGLNERGRTARNPALRHFILNGLEEPQGGKADPALQLHDVEKPQGRKADPALLFY